MSIDKYDRAIRLYIPHDMLLIVADGSQADDTIIAKRAIDIPISEILHKTKALFKIHERHRLAVRQEPSIFQVERAAARVWIDWFKRQFPVGAISLIKLAICCVTQQPRYILEIDSVRANGYDSAAFINKSIIAESEIRLTRRQ